MIALNQIHAGDCLDLLAHVDSKSVDLVFADLPYGRTQNTWDVLVPLDRLWLALRRVCKPNAVMAFTAMQPFASILVTSNLADFKYEMVWRKNKATGFLNAKKQPLRIHETVQVFYREQPAYAPQMTQGHKPMNAATQTGHGKGYGAVTKITKSAAGSTERYPTSVLEIPIVNNDDPRKVHATQKPEALAAWFVNSYTKEGGLVLDPTCGSGSTLCAAARLGRNFLGFELDGAMAALAQEAVAATQRETNVRAAQ